MDGRPGPLPLRVLIAGAGVAGLEALLALRALAEERVAVELLAPDTCFEYRPLAVAEPFGAGHVQRFELPPIAEAAGARLHHGSLASVDPPRHAVRVTRGQPILLYDVLVVASGARPREALPGALTFRGAEDADAVRALLDDCRDGRVRTLVFAVPGGVTWPLPLYELALLTGAQLAAEGAETELALVTPEREPLEVFGSDASAMVRNLLAARGIRLLTETCPAGVEGAALRTDREGMLSADRVVTLPHLKGPQLAGLPQTQDGFLRTDPFGRVEGVPDVFAAGDATDFPIKQGGIAAQQADAAARTIAAQAGAPVEPEPFRPVLRGVLLTGAVPRYLVANLNGGRGGASEAAAEPLWWPPAKIVGRYLAPFLAAHAGLAITAAPPVEGAT
ncbi:MAG: FAD-dependent oxidoreductase [Gaiellaceae bacterium]